MGIWLLDLQRQRELNSTVGQCKSSMQIMEHSNCLSHFMSTTECFESKKRKEHRKNIKKNPNFLCFDFFYTYLMDSVKFTICPAFASQNEQQGKHV